MIERLPELARAIRAVYDNCNVQPDERVVIYTDSQRKRELADLFLAEATSRGCDAIQIWTESRPPMVEPSRTAIEAMKTANIVFDITGNSWLYTQAHGEVIGTGHTRMLQVRAPESRIIERPPEPSLIRKARLAKELFDSAEEQVIRVTSELGTDFTASYAGRPVNPQDTVVLKPGDWDSVGTGFCNCFPIENTAEGTVVFNGPFYLSGGQSFIAVEPVTAKLRHGRVVSIEGGSDARRFRDWIDSYGDPNMRVLAHVGFGYNPRGGPPPKPAEAGDYGSWETINGGVIVAFGANLGRSGGQNAAPSHCDLILLGANFFIGNKQIINEGGFVIDGMVD